VSRILGEREKEHACSFSLQDPRVAPADLFNMCNVYYVYDVSIVCNINAYNMLNIYKVRCKTRGCEP